MLQKVMELHAFENKLQCARFRSDLDTLNGFRFRFLKIEKRMAGRKHWACLFALATALELFRRLVRVWEVIEMGRYMSFLENSVIPRSSGPRRFRKE